ncbi:hypothetical protein XA68_14831 [Ophiocordyceps unilateralis]|uniref:Mitochondrial import inner membrane translocase subunit TIM50 n=1 Tax=Ophiocordyceps unilateralis TaxID=268505 RepID=A0A2A9PMQ9_OPHUN|nr:hypothetical protein XA68_14831 [Ophiocordyceps unilateralis]
MLSRVARAPRLAAVGRLSLCRVYSGGPRKPARSEPVPPRAPQSSGKASIPSRPLPQNLPPARLPRDGVIDSAAATPSVPSDTGKTPHLPPQQLSSEKKKQASADHIPAANPQVHQCPPHQSTPEQEARETEVDNPYATGQTPLHNLPDLTRGIPSTLEEELQKQVSRPSAALQTVDAEGRGRRGRRETYVPSSERNRSWWIRFVLFATAVGSSCAIVHMGRNWDDSIEANRHPEAPNGWSLRLWWQRVKARMGESVSYYQDPAFEKLLPDPDPSFERPYTLCLSLDDLLIHSEWSREHGWRIAKRPGMDYFVRYLSQYYELVLFTSVPFSYAEPLVRKLDPFRFIMWPLYREATKFEDGEIVKDLSFLNRDLSKVIIIDTNATHVRKQPENAIVLEPWKGDVKDKELVGLIPFLEYIYTMQHPDVRKVLKSFHGKHIPTEFARREAIARKEFNKQLEAQKSKYSKASGMGALGSLLGLRPDKMSMTVAADGEQNPAEAFAQGKMLQDLARERGQRNFALLEKEIRENGEKWLKEEQAAMEKAQKEAMTNTLGSLAGWFYGSSKPESGDKP